MVWVASIFLLATITMILSASYALLTGSSLKTAYIAAVIVMVMQPFYSAQPPTPHLQRSGNSSVSTVARLVT